jgi:hypothetical protein
MKQMASNTCRICGRPLTDYTSVRLGIGPVCRTAYYGYQEDLFMEIHAIFDIIKESQDFVFIKDIGHKNHIAITNDAQFVLSKLAAEYDINRRRVFYMDSDGQIDEIEHHGVRFVKFRPGHKGVEL